MPQYLWVVVILGAFLLFSFIRREILWRSGTFRVKEMTFRADWLPYLEKNVPIYRRMPLELREDLQTKTMMFIEHKQFVPCGDLEITDEMRVTIGGNAALLLLNRPVQTQPFKKVLSVLIYPSSFFNNRDEEAELMSGEAWPSGSVVLAWDSAKKSARDLRDGKNLILHEFAHQLDLETGEANGRPALDDYQLTTWARVMLAEFRQHQAATAAGRITALDKYGAQDPSEFFAVATEAFFEMPTRLTRDHPDLFEELKRFYRVDPTRWTGPVSGKVMVPA